MHWYRVWDQPNGWGCGALEQTCSKPSVPMSTGAGCVTNPTNGVAALLSKLVASFLYTYVHWCRVRDQPNGWGCGALEQACRKPSVPMCRVRDQSRWRGRCSLAHSRCRGGGVAGDQARGRGCFSYSSLPATLQNSFDLHSFMSRISSQTCVSLDDLTYMYHEISLRSIKNNDVAVYFLFQSEISSRCFPNPD
jgi:hypothetical protein